MSIKCTRVGITLVSRITLSGCTFTRSSLDSPLIGRSLFNRPDNPPAKNAPSPCIHSCSLPMQTKRTQGTTRATLLLLLVESYQVTAAGCTTRAYSPIAHFLKAHSPMTIRDLPGPEMTATWDGGVTMQFPANGKNKRVGAQSGQQYK